MPPRIAALPRAANGFPVPYVAAWTGEMPLGVGPCRYARGERSLIERGDARSGEPKLGAMNLVRQREVVTLHRCQVCHLELPRRGPWWLLFVESGVGENGELVAMEPWVCPACLVYAAAVCPGLAGVRRKGELFALRVHAALTLATVTHLGGLRANGQLAEDVDVNLRDAIGYFKIALTRFDVVDIERVPVP